MTRPTLNSRSRGPRYADEDSADARVVDGHLVVTVPWSELDRAPAWRWSLASEYGTTAELGSRLAARDDLPDGDQPIGMQTSAG